MFYDRDGTSQILSLTRVSNRERLHAAVVYLIQMKGFSYYHLSLRGYCAGDRYEQITMGNLPEKTRKGEVIENPELDPLVHYAATRSLPMDWTSILAQPIYQKRHYLHTMVIRARCGLLRGCTIPLTHTSGVLGRLDLICDRDDETTERCIRDQLPCASLLGHVLFDKVRELARGDDESAGDRDTGPPLSPRERECLLWASEGRTNGEISELLGISERTVLYHVNHACRKLNARGLHRQRCITGFIRSSPERGVLGRLFLFIVGMHWKPLFGAGFIAVLSVHQLLQRQLPRQNRPGHRVLAVAGMEFSAGVADVVDHGAFDDAQSLADLFVGVAFAGPHQAFALAIVQGGDGLDVQLAAPLLCLVSQRAAAFHDGVAKHHGVGKELADVIRSGVLPSDQVEKAAEVAGIQRDDAAMVQAMLGAQNHYPTLFAGVISRLFHKGAPVERQGLVQAVTG